MRWIWELSCLDDVDLNCTTHEISKRPWMRWIWEPTNLDDVDSKSWMMLIWTISGLNDGWWYLEPLIWNLCRFLCLSGPMTEVTAMRRTRTGWETGHAYRTELGSLITCRGIFSGYGSHLPSISLTNPDSSYPLAEALYLNLRYKAPEDRGPKNVYCTDKLKIETSQY